VFLLWGNLCSGWLAVFWRGSVSFGQCSWREAANKVKNCCNWILPARTLAASPVPCVQYCLWLDGLTRSSRRCDRDGRVCNTLAAAVGLLLGLFSEAGKVLVSSLPHLLLTPALSCCLLLVRIPPGCQEGERLCRVPPFPRAGGRLCVSPATSAAGAGGALRRDKGSQSSLPPRLLDDFQITSLLEISLYFFWSTEQLKYWENSCWVDQDQALVKCVSSHLSWWCRGVARGL